MVAKETNRPTWLRGWPLAVLVIVVLVLAVFAVLAVTGLPGPTTSPTGAGSAPAPTGCVAPTGAQQQDVDTRDSPELAWARPPGQKVTVYFENRGIPDRYWGMVQTAATIWSRSGCVQAVATATIPDGANSVGVKEGRSRSTRSHTDGEFSGRDGGQYRTGGTITLFTAVLDKESDNGALATVVHEMGHALGLVHRNNPADVMNGVTNDQTNPVPDTVDFANLIAIYGQPS